MKRNMGVGLALVLAIAALAVAIYREPRGSLVGTQVESRVTLSKIMREKVLRVGYIEYPPTAFRDPQSGVMRGHFVDTLAEILRQLDPAIRIEYEETTWADFMAALYAGRIDLSIAGTFTTIPRSRAVAFTRPLVYLGRGAIVRKGDDRFSPDRSPKQFDSPSIRVGVVAGEGSHEFVKANFANQDNVTVFSGSDLSQCLAAVSAGQVDVGMSDAMETQKYVKAHADVVDLYADHPYNLTPIAWAVRQDDLAWKEFLDNAITLLEVQGELAAFEQQYDFRWVQPVIEYRSR